MISKPTNNVGPWSNILNLKHTKRNGNNISTPLDDWETVKAILIAKNDDVESFLAYYLNPDPKVHDDSVLEWHKYELFKLVLAAFSMTRFTTIGKLSLMKAHVNEVKPTPCLESIAVHFLIGTTRCNITFSVDCESFTFGNSYNILPKTFKNNVMGVREFFDFLDNNKDDIAAEPTTIDDI